MKMRTTALILASALLAGCAGSVTALPTVSAALRQPQGDIADGSSIDALVRIRIPRRGRRPDLHPATISPLTHSLSIAVNTAKAQIFNATPSSPGCAIGSKGTTCTFAVHAKAGTDTFAVTTYSGVNGTGTALDRGIAAMIPIAKGKANHVAVTLGPLVTNVANTGVGSLRYAIASANPGDTITFALAKGSVITLASPIFNTGNLTIAGPGAAYVAISGGSAHQLFDNAGTLTISGLALVRGRAAVNASPGGAIQNGGTLTLDYDTVAGSTSVEAFRHAPGKFHMLRSHGLHPHTCTPNFLEAGAVYNTGVLATSHTTFSGNVVRSSISTCTVGEGGAIFNDAGGTMSSTDDTYTNNSAGAGGAVYNAGLGAATFTGDSFTGNTGCTANSGCPTSGCSAKLCTSYAAGQGAAINDAGTGITVTASTFTDNVAGGKTAASVGQGGAIYLSSALPSITKSTFTGNLAGGGSTSCSTGAGGAIFSTNAFEIDNDTFKNNAAIGDSMALGGAVAGGDAITAGSDAFSGNESISQGGPCSNKAEGIGGGIYTAAGTLTISNSTFAGNSASGGYAASAGGAAGAGTGIVTNCSFTSNTALANGAGAAQASAAGGALVFGVGKVANSTFTSNTVTAESAVAQSAFGGAVAAGSGELVSTGDTFTSNAAIEKTAPDGAGGGAIVAVTGDVLSTNDKFATNSASAVKNASGGAILAPNGAEIHNAVVTGNKASAQEAEGGAILMGGGGLLAQVVATGNVANGTTIGGGGALFDGSGATISGSTFSQNAATSAGGAIYTTMVDETIVGSTIDDNTVTKAGTPGIGGGGIYEDGGIDITLSTIAGNTVTVSGLGPDGGGGILDNNGILMIQATISGNRVLGSAPQSGGGGIVSAGQIIALNTTISGNSSSVNGGGLYSVGTAGTMLSNVTFFQNTATGLGGNLYNSTGGALTLTNTVAGGGKAAGGSDIDNLGTITSGDYNIVQTAVAGTAMTGTTTHNLTADPKLLALSNNGGATFTNADQATSPGKARIPYASFACNGVSITTDQRGYTRGAGGRCDVGAFEYGGVATAIGRAPAIPKHVFRHRAPRLRLPLVRIPSQASVSLM